MNLFAPLTFLVISIQYTQSVNPILKDTFIKSINSKQSTWTAQRNFPETTTTEHLKRLASIKGIHPDPNFVPPTKNVDFYNLEEIPETFDAREKWPKCPLIGTIRDQGGCGSCWAFGAVEVMSDRLCIESSGEIQFKFAPEELLGCCQFCGFGCLGGFLYTPFLYWDTTGIPSGGDEGSNEGCLPYTAGSSGLTPACERECRTQYGKSWAEDVRFGVDSFMILTQNVTDIQAEILTNGPVEAAFVVYDDFYSYKEGIYQHVDGNFSGLHAVKIIGWGSENDLDYWLIANSWGTDWGNLDGFFKILRGENHCFIESYITGGTAKINE